MTNHKRDHHAAGPSGPGSVVLDIGPGTGALVIFAPATMLGAEIDISPDGSATPRTHSQVRQRVSGARPDNSGGADVSYAAVYPGLVAGQYTIWRDADATAGAVTVAGGQVTTWHRPPATDRGRSGAADL